jgi:hypothetical protein
MKTVTVVLDGEEYEVQELRSKANRAWREQLEEHFVELTDAITELPDAEVDDAQAIARLVRSISGKLLRSVDILAEMLQAYDPDLPVDKAYDSEILDAFAKVLELAYPFGGMVERIKGVLGNLKQQTSQS